MKNRFKEFVFETEEKVKFYARAKEGETFEISVGKSGELIIRTIQLKLKFNLPKISQKQYAKELSIYEDIEGNIAVVPPGWTVSGIEKENTIFGKNVSLVIYQIPEEEVSKIDWENPEQVECLKRKYSQFVWVPVNLLDYDGTLDGNMFNEQFGRRNYYQENLFSEEKYNEPLKGGLLEQVVSVNKYNGFYISRYTISKSNNAKPVSLKDKKPWINVSYNEAKELAACMIRTPNVKSHLTFGAEYDSILAWFLKSEARTLHEINTDSTTWGNYWNTNAHPKHIMPTGSNDQWSTNNIYDFAGNVDEWTQEMKSKIYRVSRGGSYDFDGYDIPVTYRSINDPSNCCGETGFRVVLYIK